MRALAGFLGLCALLACSANDGGGFDEDGSGSGGSSGSSGSGGSAGSLIIDAGGGSSGGGFGGSNAGSCASGAEWIYLLDSNETLIQFRPDTLDINVIGQLSCPGGGASPFSMSVDRTARAWVLYNNGSIFHVNVLDASCTATNFVGGQVGLDVFGMGFVADSPGSAQETLFIAGGAGVGQGSATLAWIDTAALTVNTVTSITGWPELTGTGSGELWGFAPDTLPPTIRNFDKATGATLTTYQLQGLSNVDYSAWAFAFWGGSFFVFLNDSASTTNFWRYDPTSGALENAVPDSGYRIVGAGVSTCAPVEPPK